MIELIIHPYRAENSADHALSRGCGPLQVDGNPALEMLSVGLSHGKMARPRQGIGKPLIDQLRVRARSWKVLA